MVMIPPSPLLGGRGVRVVLLDGCAYTCADFLGCAQTPTKFLGQLRVGRSLDDKRPCLDIVVFGARAFTQLGDLLLVGSCQLLRHMCDLYVALWDCPLLRASLLVVLVLDASLWSVSLASPRRQDGAGVVGCLDGRDGWRRLFLLVWV